MEGMKNVLMNPERKNDDQSKNGNCSGRERKNSSESNEKKISSSDRPISFFY